MARRGPEPAHADPCLDGRTAARSSRIIVFMRSGFPPLPWLCQSPLPEWLALVLVALMSQYFLDASANSCAILTVAPPDIPMTLNVSSFI